MPCQGDSAPANYSLELSRAAWFDCGQMAYCVAATARGSPSSDAFEMLIPKRLACFSRPASIVTLVALRDEGIGCGFLRRWQLNGSCQSERCRSCASMATCHLEGLAICWAVSRSRAAFRQKAGRPEDRQCVAARRLQTGQARDRHTLQPA